MLEVRMKPRWLFGGGIGLGLATIIWTIVGFGSKPSAIDERDALVSTDRARGHVSPGEGATALQLPSDDMGMAESGQRALDGLDASSQAAIREYWTALEVPMAASTSRVAILRPHVRSADAALAAMADVDTDGAETVDWLGGSRKIDGSDVLIAEDYFFVDGSVRDLVVVLLVDEPSFRNISRLVLQDAVERYGENLQMFCNVFDGRGVQMKSATFEWETPEGMATLSLNRPMGQPRPLRAYEIVMHRYNIQLSDIGRNHISFETRMRCDDEANILDELGLEDPRASGG